MSYHNRDDVEDMNIHKELAYKIKKKTNNFRYY